MFASYIRAASKLARLGARGGEIFGALRDEAEELFSAHRSVAFHLRAVRDPFAVDVFANPLASIVQAGFDYSGFAEFAEGMRDFPRRRYAGRRASGKL